MPRSRLGFTLLEMLMAMVIMTLVFVATMRVMAGGSMVNSTTGQLTQAMLLANNVHEYAMSLAIKDPTSQYGTSISPPNCVDIHDLDTTASTPQYVSCIDVQGNALTGAYARWTQRRTVTSFELNAPGTAVADSDTNARLLTVDIRYGTTTVYTTSWVFAPTRTYP